MKKYAYSILVIFFLVVFGTSLFAQSLKEFNPDKVTFIGVWKANKKAHPQLILPGTYRFSYLEKKAKNKNYLDLSVVEILPRGTKYTIWEQPKKNKSRNGDYFQKTVNIVDGSWKEIQTSLKKPSRYHLKNIEVNTLDGGKENYLALFARGSKKQELHKAANWNAFVSTWKKVSKKNMRLTRVKYNDSNQSFIGLFEKGKQGYYLFNFVGWKNFTKKWEELGKKDYRLIDIEVYKEKGKTHYVGVWQAGKGGYYLWNVNGYYNFQKKFNELKKKGFQLTDLEVIE